MRPSATARALEQGVEERAQQRHVPVVAAAEHALEAGAQLAHRLGVQLARLPTEDLVDEGDGLRQARMGAGRGLGGRCLGLGAYPEGELPALRVVVDRHALHLQRADLGETGDQAHGDALAAAGGGCGQAGAGG
ncbi:MAG: hypothetical protein QMC09_12000 [Thauera sp.]